MNANGLPADETLERLLAQLDEALDLDTPEGQLDTSLIEADRDLADQWQRTAECLEMLDRVRRRWTPPAVTDETLGWQGPEAGLPDEHIPITLGRFHIERELGRGGLGIVYLADDPKLGRKVALKVPRIESLASSDQRRRFLREAEAAARLNHPHLVTVLDAGEEGPLCFIAAEYCPGPTLSAWLREQVEPVPILIAARFAQQLATALQHAHGRGVLHRDVKPSNILLVDVDGAPSPKLTDFGMAKLLEHEGEETRSGVMIGTPAYMSPEQARGQVRELDARTDIYALGAVLYELLTGRRVVQGESDVDTLRKIVSDEPRTPRSLRHEIPRDLEAICLKCLAKDREARYATAQELADDLQRFIRGEPTIARPIKSLERLAKWARRRPAQAALAAVSSLAVVVVVSGSLAYAIRVSNLIALAEHREMLARHSAYSSDMRIAADAWVNSVPGETMRLLQRHLSRAGEPDVRDFAWHFLYRQVHDNSTVLARHEGGVEAVAATRDGRTLATAGADGVIRLWETQSRRQLAELRGHKLGPVHALAFSPDGKTLVSGGDDSLVRRWQVPSGEQLEGLRGGTGWVADVEISPDGALIAAAGNDRFIRLWHSADGRPAGALNGHKDIVRGIVFAGRGNLFSTSEDGEVRGWNLAKMAPDERIENGLLKKSSDNYSALVMEPGGETLIGITEADFTFWWVGEDDFGKRRVETAAYLNRLNCAAYDRTDNVALGNDHGRILLGRPERKGVQLVYYGHGERVNSLAFVNEAGLLLSGSRDGTARLFPGPRYVFEDRMNPGSLAALEWRGKYLASRSELDVRVMDLETGEQMCRVKINNSVVRISPRTSSIIALSRDDVSKAGVCRATKWNDPQESDVWSKKLSRTCHDLALDDDEKWVAAAAGQNLLIMDLESGRVVRQCAHPQELSSIEWVPTTNLVATTANDGIIRVWDSESGELRQEYPGDIHNLDDLTFSRDGARCAVHSGGEIVVLQRLSGKRLIGIPFESGVDQIALVGDGKTLVTFNTVTGPRFWQVESGAEIMDLRRGFPCFAMAISPDGHRIATQHDQFLKILDGRPVNLPPAHP